MKKYIALFENNNCDSYNVVIPDVPECKVKGVTYEDALCKAHEELERIASEGKRMPEARTFEEIKNGWEDWTDWKSSKDFTVEHIFLSEKISRKKLISITLETDLIERISLVTKNRSAFLAEAAERMLDDPA